MLYVLVNGADMVVTRVELFLLQEQGEDVVILNEDIM